MATDAEKAPTRIGSRLGLGCCVGGFLSRVAQGDVSGWIFGVRYFDRWTGRRMAREMATFGP